MGKTLHNKIYLGRRLDLHSRSAQVLLAAGFAVGIALVWLALRALK